MTFIIGRVKSHDFGSYAFHAVNDVGHTSHEVRLTHDQSPTRSSSTGTYITVAPFSDISMSMRYLVVIVFFPPVPE